MCVAASGNISMFFKGRATASERYQCPTGFFVCFFFLFIILGRYRFLIYKFTNSTMSKNSYTN